MVCGLLEFEILEVMMTAEDMVKVVVRGGDEGGGGDCDGGGGGALGMPGEMDKLEVVEVEAVENMEKTPRTGLQWKEWSSTLSWKNSPAHYIKVFCHSRSIYQAEAEASH